MKKLNQSGAIGHIEIALIAVLILAGGVIYWRVDSANNATKDSSDKALQASQSNIESEVLPEIEGLKTLEEIGAMVKTEAGDAKAIQIKLQEEDGKTVYKIYLDNGKVLVYDAATGAKLADETHTETATAGDVDIFASKISMADAIAKAKAERAGKAVSKVEIEVEEGKLVYSVRFTDGGRVDVDATSGEITRVKDAKKSGGNSSSDDDDDSSDDDDDDNDDNSGSGSRNSGSGSSNSGSGSGDDDDDDSSDDDSSDDDDEAEDDDDNSGSGSDDDEDDDDDNSGSGN